MGLIEIYFAPCSILQPDPELEKALRDLCEPMPESLDWKIFSPLHSQMQVELGSSYLYNPVNCDVSNNTMSTPFQYGTNALDINKFLNSVLVNTNDSPNEDSGIYSISAVESGTPEVIDGISRSFVKDTGSCSESEAEVTQQQVQKLDSFRLRVLCVFSRNFLMTFRYYVSHWIT